MGDFNLARPTMERYIELWHLPLSILETTGGSWTRAGQVKRMAIDYMLVTDKAKLCLTKSKTVHHTALISDHKPVVASF